MTWALNASGACGRGHKPILVTDRTGNVAHLIKMLAVWQVDSTIMDTLIMENTLTVDK